jgi:hypothetical protein
VCAQIGDNTAGLKNTVQQSRHDIRLESRFAGGTFRLPGYMGGTQNTGAVKPSSPPVAAWADLARRLAHDPRRGWRSAAWPLSPSRLDASVSSTEPHTPAPDEQRQGSWRPPLLHESGRLWPAARPAACCSLGRGPAVTSARSLAIAMREYERRDDGASRVPSRMGRQQ